VAFAFRFKVLDQPERKTEREGRVRNAYVRPRSPSALPTVHDEYRDGTIGLPKASIMENEWANKVGESIEAKTWRNDSITHLFD
jgi:hypothetical protein